MAKQKELLDKEEAEVVQLQQKNLQMQMAESGSQGEDHFLSEQATPEKIRTEELRTGTVK